jgi:Tol biopolymer transport system component
VGGAFARYAESGHLVFPRNGSVLAVPFDLDRESALGREAPLGFAVARRNNPWREQPQFFDWSPSGTLAYVPPDGIVEHEKSFAWLGRDRARAPIPDVEEFDSREPWWDLSPRGERLAFTSESYEIWLRDLDDGGPPLRLTLGGDCRQPTWNPQGTRLAAVRGGAGVLEVVILAGDGSETESSVAATFRRDQIGGYLFLYSWTPDGKNILCHNLSSVWAVPADGSSEPRELFDTNFHESFPVVSPDGSLLAYVSDRSGDLDIYVSPYPEVTSKPPVRISRNGALEPRWARDGRKLYFREGRLLVVAAIEAGGNGVRVGVPESLHELGVSRFAGSTYAVATDDRVMVLEDRASAERNRLVVVENWFQELERLVPANP